MNETAHVPALLRVSRVHCAAHTTDCRPKKRTGPNALRTGIAAVTARLENGTLRVLPNTCPNLLAEAELYHYATAAESARGEVPQDEHNHALSALRYLIVSLDARKLSRKGNNRRPMQPETKKKAQEKWLSYKNETLWTQIW